VIGDLGDLTGRSQRTHGDQAAVTRSEIRSEPEISEKHIGCVPNEAWRDPTELLCDTGRALRLGRLVESTNVSDVTIAGASRVTPAVTTAQVALSDAMAARDRECKGGVGKFCRDREAALVERRQVLDAAQAAVGQQADPQTDAAIKLFALITLGALRPAPEDFTMLRLVLFALLPQIGGLLMMVARRADDRAVLPSAGGFLAYMPPNGLLPKARAGLRRNNERARYISVIELNIKA
jgi:hypothetical protein